MLVAITGTPGVGKTSLLSQPALQGYGYEIVSVEDLATRHWAITGKELREIDVDKLASKMERSERMVMLDGHLSHYLNPDICIVLRCHPEVLEARLRERDYDEQKIRDNVEAEAIDLVLIEAMELNEKVYEIDNTDTPSDKTAQMILEIISGRTEGYEPGQVDWSGVIFEWY